MDSEFTNGKKIVNRSVIARAPAKVNLHLEILRQRHDGYHEVETILQAVSLFDEVKVTLAEQYVGGKSDIEVSVRPKEVVPADETNLCWQAAAHFCREMGLSGRLLIELEKNIPVAAGLGGGSSDAAAVLMSCDRLFGTNLDSAELERLGTPLGADVPFFINGGTALGRGIGTLLMPLPRIRTGQFLIAKPDLKLLTNEVYGNLKMGLTVNVSKVNIAVIKSILARFPQTAWPGFNRLEEAVLPQQPLLQRLVLQLREEAPVAMLSGSGSAVVAVFGEGEDISELREDLVSAGLFVRVVGPHTTGVQVGDG
ncbi:MAG: 4-(cytidine 5'-diphospho)-2-C-methyl-D-erythritol kinase [Gemmatimonadales bacterium]|nr:4-(cytidine 5'-diphospho)-2-C-methyl-D-erythritol kinase [Gemmatimonadales bacterium]